MPDGLRRRQQNLKNAPSVSIVIGHTLLSSTVTARWSQVVLVGVEFVGDCVVGQKKCSDICLI